MQVGLIEQVARKLRAGSGQVGPVGAMPSEHAADPDPRTEDQREQQQACNAKKDRHGFNRDMRSPTASILQLDVGLRDDPAELLGLRDHEGAVLRRAVIRRGTMPCTSSFSAIALSRKPHLPPR